MRVTEIADRVLVRNRAPSNWPRESVEEGNHQLDGDQTLDILIAVSYTHLDVYKRQGMACHPSLQALAPILARVCGSLRGLLL